MGFLLVLLSMLGVVLSLLMVLLLLSLLCAAAVWPLILLARVFV